MFMRDHRQFTSASSVILAIALTASATAAPLTGSGANLPIPSPNPGEPPRQGAALSSIISPTSFDGSWVAPALPAWVGTWSAQGPVPSSTAYPAGTTRYDFTTLPSAVLPAGTYFTFGDVDGGSVTTEQFILTATDSFGSLITTPWLDETLAVTGTGTGPGASYLPGNMPGWDWDSILGEYTIDGTTVTGGNPSLTVWLESNTDIAFLSVVRTSNFANFGLSAPIPEPATVALLALGGAVALRRRKPA